MPAHTDSPPPFKAPIVELNPQSGKPSANYPISKEWAIWLQSAVIGPVSQSVVTFSPVALTAQTAAIGTTPIPLPSLPNGLYRITYYARITTAASVNSSLTLTIGWTESGVALTSSTSAITGNTVTTVSTGSIMVQVDAATAISYATAYVSNLAGMAYRLSLIVEAM